MGVGEVGVDKVVSNQYTYRLEIFCFAGTCRIY